MEAEDNFVLLSLARENDFDPARPLWYWLAIIVVAGATTISAIGIAGIWFRTYVVYNLRRDAEDIENNDH